MRVCIYMSTHPHNDWGGCCQATVLYKLVVDRSEESRRRTVTKRCSGIEISSFQ